MGERPGTAYGASQEGRLRQLGLLVDSVSDYAIFLLSPEGLIVSWNPGAQRAKGYTAEEAIGQHFSIFYTEEDRARDHTRYELEVALREGRYQEEGWRVRKDGTRFWANVLISAVYDEGELVGFAKVTRDLTERRASEEALRSAHAALERSNRDLDQFAASAAHDLQEPLRTMSGFVELLTQRYGPDLPEGAAEYLDHVSAAAQRMSDLVRDVLEWARVGHDDMSFQPVDLAAAAERVLAGLHAMIAERAATVEVDLPSGVSVAGDPAGVELVLQNFLTNALKFAAAEQPVVRIAAAAVGDAWRVSVTDNGVGILPADRHRIFDAFTRAHGRADLRGSGLGLSIAQRIVERHGGRIGVDSHEGRGSTFWFTLPGA